jgi:hypothetical protein
MRNLPNFLDSYVEYANDDFCPKNFHLWTGISIVAAALERKVWTAQSMTTHYPNIYTLLVSHPGMGKSTAILRGTDLLEDLRIHKNPEFKIIPNQITEPALLDAMNIRAGIQIGNTTIFHSSGFFYASEASASALQNLHGNFNSTITELYDCPRIFRKKLKMDAQPTEIPNACFNILAGSTFDYLKTLVNEQSVMGGLASRFIYVICKDRIVRQSKWDQVSTVDVGLKKKLIDDLGIINKLVGKFQPTKAFIAAWEAFQPEFDRTLIALDSARMESILARKSTNVMKVCMILSAAESDNLILDTRHWDKAMQIVDDVTKDNAFILSSAMIADRDSQSGMTQLIGQTIKKYGGEMSMKELKTKVTMNGSDVDSFNKTFQFMLGADLISMESTGSRVKVFIDQDKYL